jgi:thiol-disulfide isomerase/thioredoxin
LQNESATNAEKIATENAFLALDFSSTSLFHSGLSKELFDEYLKHLFQQSSKEAILNRATIFSDRIKISTQSNPTILNDYCEYLIKQYEKFGLVAAAEHLALSLLDDTKCSINDKAIPLLEQYRKMAIGNSAPNIKFSNNAVYTSLSEIKAKYKVIVFGASWCEACKAEIPQFKEYSTIFKTSYDAEIVFISLDTENENYLNFTKDIPFINSCDFKGWDGDNVKSYYVFATPTIYILDDSNKIRAKPVDAVQTAAWFYQNRNKS